MHTQAQGRVHALAGTLLAFMSTDSIPAQARKLPSVSFSLDERLPFFTKISKDESKKVM